MDRLKQQVALALIAAFVLLLFIDVADDLLLSNKWGGCPKEVYPLIGALVAALFAASALKRGNGNGEKKE
jgi:hypothetical protein